MGAPRQDSHVSTKEAMFGDSTTSPDQRGRAVLAVASVASRLGCDAEGLRLVLDVLGLDVAERPGHRRGVA